MRELASSFDRQRLRLRLRILRGKPWPLASALCPLLPPGQRRAITVIHGRGVDAVFVLAAQARSGPLSALIVWPASAPPPSSSATGGSSWSCVHSPLKLLQIY